MRQVQGRVTNVERLRYSPFDLNRAQFLELARALQPRREAHADRLDHRLYVLAGWHLLLKMLNYHRAVELTQRLR